MSRFSLDIEALSKDERLTLIEKLWESLSSDEEPPITDVQRTELKARVDALVAGKLKMLDVEEVLEAIRSRPA